MSNTCPICGRLLCRTALGDSTDYEQRAKCYRTGYARERQRADLEQARNDRLRGLLIRLSEWDHMRSAGDGPFWRREIVNALRGFDPADVTSAADEIGDGAARTDEPF